MGRPRKYKSDAERQQAYRERKKAEKASDITLLEPDTTQFTEMLQRVATGPPTTWEEVQSDLAKGFRGPDPK